MLSQLVTDTDLLRNLVIAFFDPETSGNASLRQALSYFLPVYCHSRAANAERMTTVATGVIARLSTLREAFIEDEDVEEGDMVTLGVVGGLLVDWTDPRKLVGSGDAHDKLSRVKIEEGTVTIGDADMTHFMLAEQILEKLVTSQTSSKSLFHVAVKTNTNTAGRGRAESAVFHAWKVASCYPVAGSRTASNSTRACGRSDRHEDCIGRYKPQHPHKATDRPLEAHA